MADLIKKIKIKKQDGTFTDYIPIGAEAKNVDCSDGESVEYKLNNISNKIGKKPYYYNNILEMQNDNNLKVGDMAITLGYYEANDGGGAEYKIVNRNNSTKNKFNRNAPDIIDGFVDISTGLFSSQTNNQRSFVVKLKPNTTYTYSGFERSSNYGLFSSIPNINDVGVGIGVVDLEEEKLTFTTTSTHYYFVAMYTGGATQTSYSFIQVEEGNNKTAFTPSPDVTDNGSLIFLENVDYLAKLVLKENINIKNFGAKGDNNNLDTIAINNAIKIAIIENKKQIYFPQGIYLTSGVLIEDAGIHLYGDGIGNTIIKAKNDFSETDSIIKFKNTGTYCFKVTDLTIDGNKANNLNNLIDGMTVFINSGKGSDTFATIQNIEICNCSGSGLVLDGVTTTNIREIRVLNNRFRANNEYGFYGKSMADSVVAFNTSHSNLKAGYYFSGGNIKINGNKAFFNGRYDNETLEDYWRLPASALNITSDNSPLADKEYYTRTGSGVTNNPYTWTLFTGSSFLPNIDYYERLNKPYYKRYPGYEIRCWSSLIVNCESQDNAGDGFYIADKENQLSNILADGNGHLLDKNEETISYIENDIEPLYDGVYIIQAGENTSITGDFRNFRYREPLYDKYQRAAIGLYRTKYITADINTRNQVVDIYNELTSLCKITVNAKKYFYYHNLNEVFTFRVNTSYSNLQFEFHDSENNKSYIKTYGNDVYLHLSLKTKDNQFIPNETHDELVGIKIGALDKLLQPDIDGNLITIPNAMIVGGYGLNYKGIVAARIEGQLIMFKPNDTYTANCNQIILDMQYNY